MVTCSISNNELEFLAENEIVSIIPNFTLKDQFLHCIGGDYGPFIASFKAQVPLWLALNLKKMEKCRIILPEWMSYDSLKQKMENERKSDLFEQLPTHYAEVAAMLFQAASDDIDDVENIRTMMEDLQTVRQDKIRNGIQRIANDVQSGGTAYAVQMNNVGAMELNAVRDFMIESLNRFYEFNGKESDALHDSQLESQQFSELVSPDMDEHTTPLRRRR